MYLKSNYVTEKIIQSSLDIFNDKTKFEKVKDKFDIYFGYDYSCKNLFRI